MNVCFFCDFRTPYNNDMEQHTMMHIVSYEHKYKLIRPIGEMPKGTIINFGFIEDGGNSRHYLKVNGELMETDEAVLQLLKCWVGGLKVEDVMEA